MMAPLLLALMLQAAPPSAVVPPHVPSPAASGAGATVQPPALDSWNAFPPLTLLRPAIDMAPLSRFVRGEVEGGRCTAAIADASGNTTVHARVAVLVRPDGGVRRIVPAAIGCPTVEQFTAGVIGRLASGNVRAPWPQADRWYRAGITYSWTRGGAPADAPPR